jgi:hypothetical protein
LFAAEYQASFVSVTSYQRFRQMFFVFFCNHDAVYFEKKPNKDKLRNLLKLQQYHLQFASLSVVSEPLQQWKRRYS